MLLQGFDLNQKDVLAKVAELFVPEGMCKPVKLKLKLKLTKVNSLQWDECLKPPEQVIWKETLTRFKE